MNIYVYKITSRIYCTIPLTPNVYYDNLYFARAEILSNENEDTLYGTVEQLKLTQIGLYIHLASNYRTGRKLACEFRFLYFA